MSGTAGLAFPANAATTNTLYSYTFGGSTTSISNDAAANSGVNLTLQGDVSIAANGHALHFDGDRVSKMSVGYTKPATGSTLSAAASDSYGFALKFTHQLPGTQTCFTDSHNYAQIGRNGAGLSQFKLQSSNCNASSTAVYPECRVAGSVSATGSPVVRGTQALVNGETYVVRCIKEADTTSGTGPIVLITQRLASSGVITTTDTFSTMAATGAFNSTAYLSVGNKYALPAQAQNTDQMIGDVYKLSVCKATTTNAVQTCLDTDNPNTLTTQYVSNRDLESGVTGWTGVYGSNITITQDSTEARSGSSSLKAVYTGTVASNSGIKDVPLQVTNTVQGQTYTASVWVKSPVSKTMNLKIRELNASGVEIASNKETVVSNNTGWQQVTTNFTATQSGSSLSFGLYSYASPSAPTFYADDFSLTSSSSNLPPVPTTTEYVTNSGIETDVSGWTGIYGSNVTATRDTTEAHTGTSSLKATYTSSTATNSGIKDIPMHVTNTVQGKTYTGSVWVKAPINRTMNLKLRELNASGVEISSQKATVVATSAGWVQVNTSLTATQNGSSISFGLYAYSDATTNVFYADDFSLIAEN